MALDTHKALDANTIGAVRELIEINVDSYTALNAAAAQTSNLHFQRFFAALATERVRQAIELRRLVYESVDGPMIELNLATPVSRSIMDWQAAFGGGLAEIIQSATRAETYVTSKYEAAIAKTHGSIVCGVLRRQYEAVRNSRDRIHGAMKDARDS